MDFLINVTNETVYQEYTNSGGNVLWQANDTDARGQLTQAVLGNGVSIENTYDYFGLPSKIKHDKTAGTPINIMTLDTEFDPTYGNLYKRSSNLFNTVEGFAYDEFDRLISWTIPEEPLVNCTFTTNIDGFEDNYDAQGYHQYYSQNGKLQVVLSGNEGAGIQRLITTNAEVGHRYTITGELEMPENPNRANLFATIYERDPVTGDMIGNLDRMIDLSDYSGPFELEYEVTAYTELYVKFSIERGWPYNDVSFSMDNLKAYEFKTEFQSYDDAGKITENILGAYNYTDTNKPFQTTSIKPVTQEAKDYFAAGLSSQIVSYNAFKNPVEIASGNRISFGYNAAGQRSVMYYGSNNTNKLLRPYRKYYSSDGAMEIKYSPASGEMEFVTYIGGDAYTAPMMIKSDGVAPVTSANYYYLHRDYLGSIVAITDNNANLVEKRHFDAWGGLVRVADGSGNPLPAMTFTDRGYTGHEHLQEAGLIHMNGRLYDPKLHRFLSPDNFVQEPFSMQSYNRYAYVMNNPLKYTDPSGESWEVAVGVGVAVAAYLVNAAIQQQQQIYFGGIVNAVFWGYISSVASFGVGWATQTISSFAVRASVQAAAHGVNNGAISMLQGGKFWNGFAAGSISSLAASSWRGGDSVRHFEATKTTVPTFHYGGLSGALGIGNSSAAMVAFSTVTGGAVAELTDGNFWQGAAIGFAVGALNHALHGDIGDDPPKKKGKAFTREQQDFIDSVRSDAAMYQAGLEYVYDDNIFSALGHQLSFAFPSARLMVYFLFLAGVLSHRMDMKELQGHHPEEEY